MRWRKPYLSLLGRLMAAPTTPQAADHRISERQQTGGAGEIHLPFHRGLGEVGYVDGRNVAIEYRAAEDRVDRLAVARLNLLRLQVHGIFADHLEPLRGLRAHEVGKLGW